MATHRVTLIPGDGTGPDLTEATRGVLGADRNDPSALGTSEYADAIIEQLGA